MIHNDSKSARGFHEGHDILQIIDQKKRVTPHRAAPTTRVLSSGGIPAGGGGGPSCTPRRASTAHASTGRRARPRNRWLGWKYRIRSQTETLFRSEYETPGMYPSSTVAARNLNQATARKLKQGPLLATSG
ncbi:unnamed protein product [Phytophthora fragariaefolia]|uniref:Unnamed protein product n=1 Tax=Phytophthora fragariaefolia TaxID=1490495 RepID=A0A9W6YFC6_9STRA|nr:unnamed protein product [Phytophthora fragariaefolia]